jgi:carbonic anhydrase/acetyltransferase-like protein (isoleucine patch superfamily)
MPIYAIGDQVPEIAPDAFVHPDAVVIGSVTVGSQASVWPGAVLRGDYGQIDIGARTSIQDGTVVHATAELATVVGEECLIGHMVHLEGCILERGVLVGSGAIVLQEVIVRTGGVVAAGAVVQAKTEVPSNAMALGVPAKVRLDAAMRDYTSRGVRNYVGNADRYLRELRLIG